MYVLHQLCRFNNKMTKLLTGSLNLAEWMEIDKNSILNMFNNISTVECYLVIRMLK